MAKKYYRVKKDTFLWVKGAVLEYDADNSDNGYLPINDLWNTEANEESEYITAANIENNPDWFERVYEASSFGKLTYVTKEKARTLANKFFGGAGETDKD